MPVLRFIGKALAAVVAVIVAFFVWLAAAIIGVALTVLPWAILAFVVLFLLRHFGVL